jgi:hypothetical protein
MNLNVGGCFPFGHYHHPVAKGRKQASKNNNNKKEKMTKSEHHYTNVFFHFM